MPYHEGLKRFATSDRDENTRHEAADILEVYATLPDYVAFGDHRGSWFIRAFIEEVCSSAHNLHLADILVDVDGKVQNKMTNADLVGSNKYIQAMQVVNSGFKRFYFLPGYNPVPRDCQQ